MAKPTKETVSYITIYGHESEPADSTVTSGIKFEAKANPASIKTKRSLLFNQEMRANTGHDVAQYMGYSAIELEMTLIITDADDNSLSNDDESTVKAQIDQLMKATYDYMGGIHKAPFVTIIWDKLSFIGHLKDMAINYTTFNANGAATRAEVELLFINHISSIANAHSDNKSSPDMTHMKLMKDGDKIPLICDEIYGDPNYYIQIAELNNLTNFRSISAGKNIIFPPLIN